MQEGEKLRVFVGFTDGTTGTIYLDDLQVEQGKVANPVNLLENAALQSGSAGWTTQSGLAATVSDGNLVVAANIGSLQSVGQTVAVSGKKGDIFSFGGWGKAYAVNPYKSVPEKSIDDLYGANTRPTPVFGIQVTFQNSAGTAVGDPQVIEYNWAVESNQMIAGQATAPADYAKVRLAFV